MKTIQIITLFPDLFIPFINTSIVKNAISKGKVAIRVINLRDFGVGKHRQVDDYQVGGGAGMVLKVDVVVNAIRFALESVPDSKTILLTPQGQLLKQKTAFDLANAKSSLILICGHYEGFDERIRDYVDLELSIGDYILSAGEIASMVISDAIIRLIPGVIQEESHLNDSFTNNYLDYPVFTKPLEFENKIVPEILLTGHHKNIDDWRQKQAFYKTYLRRKDLIKIKTLTKEEKQFLLEIKKEKKNKKGK